MKNNFNLRTWRNKIGRDSKIQEFRKTFRIPFSYEKEQGKYAGRKPANPHFKGYLDYNFVQVVQPLNLFILQAKNPLGRMRELSQMVEDSFKKGMRIKAVGTGHSYADIATTNDGLLLTEELNAVLKDPKGKNKTGIQHDNYLDPEAPLVKTILESKGKEKAKQRFFYEFESGIKIYQLNEALENESPKLGLDNMGTYQGQSFIGAASTSTHGSGIGLGALPDMIRSICIVADGGLIFRIESKTDRLTKRGKALRTAPFISNKKWPKQAKKSFEELTKKGDLMYSPEGNGVLLIQNDDWFHAAQVNVGCFGIIYSLIIEVGLAYDLIETIEFATWSSLKDRLNRREADLFEAKDIEGLKGEEILKGIETTDTGLHKIRHMEILVNPYPDGSEGENTQEHYCRITRRYRSYDLQKIEKDRVPDDISVFFAKTFEVNPRAEGATVKRNKTTHWFLNNNIIFRTATNPDITDLLIKEKRTRRLIKVTNRDKSYIPVDNNSTKFHYRNRAWKVFPAGGDKIGGYGAEMAFSFAKNQGQDRDFVAAVDKLLDIAQLTLEEGGQAQTVPYSLRFVAGTGAFLSPQYAPVVDVIDEKEIRIPTCMIELLNSYDTIGGKELLRRYQLAMFELGGRPHWGLDMNIMSGFFLQKGIYPLYPKWKKVYDALNAFGSFDNPFTHRMGWSTPDYERKE